MNPIYVAPPQIHPSHLPPPAGEVTELLRQMVDLQRQQVDLNRVLAANVDERARWTTFYGRWSSEFPDLPVSCKRVLPAIERAYMGLLRDLSERVADEDQEPLDNEFALAEFLDKYGVRMQQLAGIMGQVGNMSNLAPVE